MKEILNKNAENYAKECLIQALDMGFDFKLNADFKAKKYDKENMKPVIKASICNGEQVAGCKDIHTGKIEEVMLIKSPSDIDIFKKMYGIDEEIAKEY